MYIVDQLEHGNGGVYGYNVLEKCSLAEALNKSPYDYPNVMPKMFGFYPIICGNKDFGNPSYRWDEDSKNWKKINGNKIKRQEHIMSISLKEVDLKKLNGCKHPDIKSEKDYLVIYNGNRIIGTFDKQWYGWSFDWFGSAYAGLQIDSFDKVYEIEYK